MPRELTDAEKVMLEQMVDSTSLAHVTETLGLIAAEKAEHIRSTWQDMTTARVWQNAGNRLDVVSARLFA